LHKRQQSADFTLAATIGALDPIIGHLYGENLAQNARRGIPIQHHSVNRVSLVRVHWKTS
jgi:hypothetical protein